MNPMKRRSFLAGLLGLPAVPLAAKAIEASPEPAVDPGTLIHAGPVIRDTVRFESATLSEFNDFVHEAGPTFIKTNSDVWEECAREAYLKKTS